MRIRLLSLRVVIAGVVCLALTLACGATSSPEPEPTVVPATVPESTKTPEPTPTIVPPTEAPTEIPTVEATSTSEPSCYRWDEITLDMAGEQVCVYGVAYSHQGQSRIDFSPEKNSFFLVDPVYYYPDLSEGSCVVAEQKVEIFDSKIPFMTINGNLFKCEPWMLE